jgi:outer membrane protein W
MPVCRWFVLAASLLATPLVSAQSLPWRVSAHLAAVEPRSSSATVTGVDWKLELDTGTGFALAAARRLSPTWELELSALRTGADACGASEVGGRLEAGSVDLTVYALVLQHRFFTAGRIQPYVGLGVHHSTFASFDPTAALVASGIATISFTDATSVAAQLGAGYSLGERFTIDVRASYFDLATDATLRLPNGTDWNEVRMDLDPFAIAVGVDFSF